jgi:hypothetical protein
MKVKVIKINKQGDRHEIIFDNGWKLYSEHEQECCEQHYIDLTHLTEQDFEGLYFDLEGEFFKGVEGYGIILIPTNGHPVAIPVYADNNGFYSDELTLILEKPELRQKVIYDITKYQISTRL